MSGLIESAAAILGASERRLEVAAHNVANISTPGFKRGIAFSRLVPSNVADTAGTSEIAVRRDFAQGTLNGTGNPLDLAISGPGLFQLRTPDGLAYSRQGQFRVAADGTVVTPQGYVLQQAGGGDLVLDRASVSVLDDGTVLDDGVPVARIGVFDTEDPAALKPLGEAYFTADEETIAPASSAVIRQGMVENSNVSLGDEMVATMATLRRSETGARLVQIYDDLLGRVFSTLGQGAR